MAILNKQRLWNSSKVNVHTSTIMSVQIINFGSNRKRNKARFRIDLKGRLKAKNNRNWRKIRKAMEEEHRSDNSVYTIFGYKHL